MNSHHPLSSLETGNKPVTAWDIGEQSGGKITRPFGSRWLSNEQPEEKPRPVRAKVAKLSRIQLPADLSPYPPEWTEADRLAFEQRWDVAAWPCSICGLIGCDCPEYRGAFDTEGRH